MRYRVLLMTAARNAVRQYLDYLINDQSLPTVAERWWERALAAIDSLQTFPNRCPIAPENEYRDYTIRALKVDQCLFLYAVDDESRAVRIIAFRHGHQQPLEKELPQTPDQQS